MYSHILKNNTSEKEVNEELYNLFQRINNLEADKPALPAEKKDKNKQRNTVKILPQLAVITFLTMLLMTIYEVIKQWMSPDITIWESHLITISFASIIAPVISFYALRKFDALQQEAQKELMVREEIEKELILTQQDLENRVIKRTHELQKTNDMLRNEIKIRKETEKAYRNSEERYKLLFRNSPVGFFHFNSNLIITDFNKKFLEIFNASPEKISNINLRTLEDKQLIPALEAALRGKEGYYEGLYHTTTSNSICYISLLTAPYFDSESRVQGGIGIVENIEERKLAEKALLEAKEKAEKSNALKSEFLALMSHEIRTPLNSMLNFANLLSDDLFDKVEDELKPGFEIIEKSGKRIIRTIDLILNMSEIQTGSYEYQKTEVDIYYDVLIDLYVDFKPAADKKQVELVLRNEAQQTMLKTDVYAAMQIINHLVDNAVKFTEKGRVEICVSNDENKNLVVSVNDSGIGMSEDYLKNLFKPFSQEEQGYSRRFEGCGLGLSLVKKYCELSGVTLNVTSQKNTGSSFTVIFPQTG